MMGSGVRVPASASARPWRDARTARCSRHDPLRRSPTHASTHHHRGARRGAHGGGRLWWKRPDMAASFYNAGTKVCPRSNIVAGDVLDTGNMTSWVRRFMQYTRVRPRIWGLHNYHDANSFSPEGTQRLLRLVKGQIWFTETGGLVRFRVRVRGRIQDRNYGIKHAALATRYVLNLSRMSPPITRIYQYHWRAPT